MHTFVKNGQTFPGLKKILESIKDGEYLVKKYDPPRNLSQNALLHGYLTYIANETWNDMEALKELMKKQFASKKKLVKIWKKKRYSVIIEQTSKMSKARFAEFFGNVERFFTEFGYPLPDRDSPEFLSLCEEWQYF